MLNHLVVAEEKNVFVNEVVCGCLGRGRDTCSSDRRGYHCVHGILCPEVAFSIPGQTDVHEEAPQKKFNDRMAMFCSSYQPILVQWKNLQVTPWLDHYFPHSKASFDQIQGTLQSAKVCISQQMHVS